MGGIDPRAVLVGLARLPDPSVGCGAVEAPFAPDASFPELVAAGIAAGSAANPGYAAVRQALAALGLDAARFGSDAWNPLSSLVRPGGHVVLKPNWIRHFNPCEGDGGSMASVVTHGSVLRAIADYAFLAVGDAGRVTIAEAPQQDCQLDRVAEWVGLHAIVEDFAARGLRLDVIDLRRETVRFEDRIVVERQPLPGDPAGYRVVDRGASARSRR